MRMRRFARQLLVAAMALLATAQCRTVHAGLVTVMNVKPNTDVTLSFTIQIAPNLPPATITRTIRTTTDTAEFGLGDLETEKEIKSVTITKTPKGQAGTITYEGPAQSKRQNTRGPRAVRSAHILRGDDISDDDRPD